MRPWLARVLVTEPKGADCARRDVFPRGVGAAPKGATENHGRRQNPLEICDSEVHLAFAHNPILMVMVCRAYYATKLRLLSLGSLV